MARYTGVMRNEFRAIIEQAEGWFVAYSPGMPGANGQGRSKEEATRSLGAAIELILEDRREEGLRGVPDTAIQWFLKGSYEAFRAIPSLCRDGLHGGGEQ